MVPKKKEKSTILLDSISIGAWNIGGIKNKSDDPHFIDELARHQIVVLGETFADNEVFSFPGYKVKNIFRTKKHKKARRNSGGVSVLTENRIADYVKPVKCTAEHLIWMKIDKKLTSYPKDLYLCCAYIPPYGSAYYKSHPDIDLFDLLSTDITNFSKLGHIMITGDLNARLGKRPDLLTENEISKHSQNTFLDEPLFTPPHRNSMDSGTNSWGSKLIDICSGHNLCLLNGRTISDLAGNFTFFGGGSSVIDLAVVDSFIFKKALSFKVHPFLPDLSLHCRIETVLGCSPINLSAGDPTIQNLSFDKYFWNNSTSPEKLVAAVKSPKFLEMKTKVESTEYECNAKGVEMLHNDVSMIFSFLHEVSCDKIVVKKKAKRKRKWKKWFSPDLAALRKRLRKAANFLHRNPTHHATRIEVFSLNKRYKSLLKKARKEHHLANMQKLVNTVDQTELWSLLSEIRGKKSGSTIPMHELHQHFSSILNNSPRNVSDRKLTELSRKIEDFLQSTSDEDIQVGGYTSGLITKKVKSLKNGKSSFLDGSINEVIKKSIYDTAPLIVKLFNHIESSGCFPNPWKCSFLVPLHKKGSPDDPDNYRGLAVGSNLGKFYTNCFNSKISKFAESKKIISPHQFGFREDFRTSDAIFSLRAMTSLYKTKNKPVFACFVDFSKAFDSVNRTALIYKLGSIGIKGNLLKLIQNMYSTSDYIIKSEGQYSFPISSTLGVKQGCNLSPLMFNIFINDIHQIFSQNCSPLNIDNWNVNSLSFADDLVLLSETEEGLKNCLTSLEAYCKEWGLKVNPDKTKVLVFNKPFTKNVKNLSFVIDEAPIKVTNSYTYLGIEVSNTGHFGKATEALYKKGLKALFGIYSCINVRADQANIPLFLKLFDTLIKPIILYGSEVWGFCSTAWNGFISKFTNKFYRTLLGSRPQSSTAGIHYELGRSPIHVSMQQTMIKFWFRLISLPKSRLVSHCYNALINNSENDAWCKTIENLINSAGKMYVWNEQNEIAKLSQKLRRKEEKFICRTLDDLGVQKHAEKMRSETKCLLLFDTKKKSNLPAKYLTLIENRAKRSTLAQLRLGTLDIEIEKSRRHAIPRSERRCNVCNLNEVEDAEHFLFECCTLEPTRRRKIDEIEGNYPGFAELSKQDKIKFLYFNENISTDLLSQAADLLYELKVARENFNNNDVTSLINRIYASQM